MARERGVETDRVIHFGGKCARAVIEQEANGVCAVIRGRNVGLAIAIKVANGSGKRRGTDGVIHFRGERPIADAIQDAHGIPVIILRGGLVVASAGSHNIEFAVAIEIADRDACGINADGIVPLWRRMSHCRY